MSRHWTACSRSGLWIGLFVTIVGLVSQTSRGQQEEREDPDDSRERMVFLTTGRMLTGRVTRNAGGYLVEQSNGRVQVAIEDVKFVVNSLTEAYRKQRDSIVEPTPATHIALANWCISHRLLDEAREELKRCLKRDPENEEGRRLLQRLTDTIRADLPKRNEASTLLKTSEGFLQPHVESVGGLSRDNAVSYISRIQPLLLNKCGNVGCHGSQTPNQFRLTLARGGSHSSRQNSERNLAEVLRYINSENAAQSQLVSGMQGSHGGKGTIFVGQIGAEQLKSLRAWVLSVAEDRQAKDRELEQQPRLAGKGHPRKRVVQAKAAITEPAATIQRAAFTDQDTEDQPLVAAEEPDKPRELKPDPTDAQALALEPDDPFDPEKFNRQFRRP